MLSSQIQNIIALSLVALATVSLARQAWRRKRTGSCASGCGSCAAARGVTSTGCDNRR